MTKHHLINLRTSRNLVLANLPAAATERLVALARQIKLPPGDALMREGDPSDSIFFILSGEVAIYKSEVEIDRQGAGGVLGEMGVLTSQPRSASVRCASAVEALKIPAESFLGVLDRHPEVLRILVRELVGRVEVSQHLRVKQVASIQKARETLSRCVSREVLDQILEHQTPERLLSGRLDEVAILFYDIKGFSAAAEKMNPRTLLRALNEHLEIITNEVARQRGTVVNFIGDAVLAVFNCPVKLANPADAALECYLNARRRMLELQAARKRLRQICFQLGAGINWGTVVSGAIGSEERFSYSVLGDEVNLAARLESLTRQYPVELILSEAFCRKLSQKWREQCVMFDRAKVKGRRRPVWLHTLTAQEEVRRTPFAAAVKAYLKGDFAAARDLFATQKHPLANYLRQRCRKLLNRKEAWPGYFSWQVK